MVTNYFLTKESNGTDVFWREKPFPKFWNSCALQRDQNESKHWYEGMYTLIFIYSFYFGEERRGGGGYFNIMSKIQILSYIHHRYNAVWRSLRNEIYMYTRSRLPPVYLFKQIHSVDRLKIFPRGWWRELRLIMLFACGWGGLRHIFGKVTLHI